MCVHVVHVMHVCNGVCIGAFASICVLGMCDMVWLHSVLWYASVYMPVEFSI